MNRTSKWIAFPLVAAMLSFGASQFTFAQTAKPETAKQDMKDAGSDTKSAVKKTGHGIAKGTKTGARKTKNGTKKVVHGAAHGTAKGADKVEDKTAPK